MLLRLPSSAYPPAGKGYWGPITSTLNFCEEDYYATIYLAEIVNSLTNVFFMGLSVKGMISCWKNKHDSIFFIAYVGCFLVATGSFLFHASLKHPMQLVDELSMIYSTCLMCYATFAYGKSYNARVALALGLLGLSAFITLYYRYIQDPVFHQVAYAILTIVVVFRSMYLMETHLRPRWQPQKTQEPITQRLPSGEPVDIAGKADDRRDAKVLESMWYLVACGLSLFLGGFVIWLLDNQYCSHLRRWRHAIGLPWGILLEGHGWWHLMTSIGAYYYIVWGTWLRHCLAGRQAMYRLHWPSLFFSFPEIVRIGTSDRAGDLYNGSAKKVE